MTARWKIPPHVRPLLEARIEELLDEVAGRGPSPVFFGASLLGAIDEACTTAKCAEVIGTFLDASRADDLGDAKLQRRITPALEKIGTHEGGRWTYPDAATLLALLETTYRIEWTLPAAPKQKPVRAFEGTAVPYAPETPVAVGTWIEHPKLGIGEVLEAGVDRIRVRFADRERMLVGRAAPSAPKIEKPSPDFAAAHAALDEALPAFVAAWAALGHDAKKTFLAACVGKRGVHPRDVAKACIALVEARFGGTLTRRTRAYDEEHGHVQRIPDGALHEFYQSPAAVLAAVVSQRVRPSGTDDGVLPGLQVEIQRRLTTIS